MIRISFLLLFISLHTFGKSILIEGKLLTASNQEPIAYANIGIIDKNIGTISNPDGSYSIRIDSLLVHEKITFSALGFERRSIELSKLITKPSLRRVLLEEKNIVLDEVSINHKLHILDRIKHASLGNDRHTSGTIRLDTAKAGGSMALKIDHKDAPFKLNNIQLYIPQSSNEFKVRVRLYAVDPATGAPGDDLLDKNIIIQSNVSKGWLKEDLSHHNIWINQEEFFLAFEWIMDATDRAMLAEELGNYLTKHPENIFTNITIVDGEEVKDTKIIGFNSGTWFGTTFSSKSVNNHECYYRTSSLSPWKRSAAILSAKADICF
jgi:hypothetical protein